MVINYFVGFFTFYLFLIVSVSGSFSDSFSSLFGHVQDNGNSVDISLDKSSGSGFVSKDAYNNAYLSASIKLPPSNTAGVVVTFYTSNAEQFPNTHDEIDFEFLGNTESTSWVLQTNIYGGGSNVQRGREERYNLWFDPTTSFHKYSILWTQTSIVFYIDDVPIRETPRVDAMGTDFPSKPMKLYATIWDGSDWATDGGRIKINYAYAPFIASYSNFVLQNGAEFRGLADQDKLKMKGFRAKYMFYSYCKDPRRYPVPLPECPLVN